MLQYKEEQAAGGMPPTRRILLRGAAAGTLAGLLGPGFVHAAEADVTANTSAYPASAFAQKTPDSAIQALYHMTATPSTAISFDAPDIAENGAVVPVNVSTTLPNVTSVAILAIGNPNTLAASYQFPSGTNGAISARIKLAKTTEVIAVVQSGGKLFSTSKNVKVTLGGCGG